MAKIDLKETLLDAALEHVPFDGWGGDTLVAAALDIGMSEADARAMFPRGAVDLAAAFHHRGDNTMLEQMKSADFASMRYSERVAAAIIFRLDAAGDKELVRRGTTLFSLPQNGAEGARLIWGTADRIWSALGDTSDDINWYSKRAILSAVYGSCVLFWLGDTSVDDHATRSFVNRRIADVMRFEKFKGKVRENPGLSRLLSIPNSLLGQIRAPSTSRRADVPGDRAKTGRGE